jgi:hypothetical protein
MGRQTAAHNENPEQPQPVIEETLLFWQTPTSEHLNAEDARQMIENVAGFFSQIDAWDRQASTHADEHSQNPEVIEISPSRQPSNDELTFKQPSCNPAHDSFAA